jgi:zinc transport system substrate-binding protein
MRRPRAASKVLAVFTLALSLSAHFPPEALPKSGDKIIVVATLFPQFDFARQIGKDKVEVYLLLPPGVEAHSFEPRPRDMARINDADIFLYTDKNMEPWVGGLLKGVTNKSLESVEAGKGAARIGSDPHIWLDMDNAAVMVDNIASAMIKTDPANRSFYEENARKYKIKLKEMDEKFRIAFADCRTKVFIYAGHPAFGYFARRYSLECLSPYKGYSPDSEPSPDAVMELVDRIRSNGIKIVYYEELLSPKLAGTVASETGAGTLPLNGAHNVSKEDIGRGVTFLSIMEQDLDNLKKGLGCRTM